MFYELGNSLYGDRNFEIEYRDGNTLDMWHYNYKNFTSVNQCIAFHKRMVHEYCNLIRNHSPQQYSTINGKALTYIHTDIGVDLSLNVLAEQLNINASYLSMLFKKEIGMTLTDYVNKYRIEHAAKLLLCTKPEFADNAEQEITSS